MPQSFIVFGVQILGFPKSRNVDTQQIRHESEDFFFGVDKDLVKSSIHIRTFHYEMSPTRTVPRRENAQIKYFSIILTSEKGCYNVDPLRILIG